MSDKCPKCQAETSYRHGAYKCGSLVHYDGQFVQSDKCRIAELEAKVTPPKTEMLMRTQQVESWAKHALDIKIGDGEWETFHIDYMARLKVMMKVLKKAGFKVQA